MSKQTAQIKALARSPKAQMDYMLRGKLPNTYTPKSPLIELLENIPPRERLQFQGIRMSPKLGYETNQIFNNAEQLLRWLKPQQHMTQPCPAESRKIQSFDKQLTIADLKSHCSNKND